MQNLCRKWLVSLARDKREMLKFEEEHVYEDINVSAPPLRFERALKERDSLRIGILALNALHRRENNIGG